jgi:predicted RNA-binding protein with PIN domain
MFCRFSGSFEPIFDPNCRGNINFRILPLQFESKSGQNYPEKRRTINFERGLMYFLIDGYNLLFRLSESKKSLQFQRQTVIVSLQKEFKCLRLEGTLVFDGRHRYDEQSGLSYHSPLVIAYSHKGQTADQYILEKLEMARVPSDITVVTDDRFLATTARGLKARTLGLKAFIVLLEKKHAKKRRQREEIIEERPIRETPRNMERLLKEFEARLVGRNKNS